MTDKALFDRAMVRLRNGTVTFLLLGVYENAIEVPLAALIKAAAEPVDDWQGFALDCGICGNRVEAHTPDCALIALLDAINGEKS